MTDRLIPTASEVVVTTPQPDRRATDRGTPDRRRDPTTARPGGGRELLLTLKEVAEVLKVDVRTIKKLIRTQALIAIRVSERNTRITEAELGRFLHRRSHPNAP